MDYYICNGELYHHGTKGMKWGKRLYQNKDGSLTALGKVRYRTNKNYKRQIDRERALAKARKARTDKKEYDEAKKKAVKSGSAEELMKFKGDLTKAEMDTAWARIQWEQNIKGVAEKEVAAGKETTRTTMDKIGDLTANTEKILKLYNTVANINNAFNPDMILPKVDTNVTTGNRDAYLKDRKDRKSKVAEAINKAEEKAKKKTEEDTAKKEQKKQEKQEKKEQKQKDDSKEESKKKSDDNKVYEGKVEGEGTSRRREPEDVVIDGEWRDVTPSSVPAVVKDAGRSYVNDLLETSANNRLLLEDKNKK